MCISQRETKYGRYIYWICERFQLSKFIILGILLLLPSIGYADGIISTDGEWEYIISQTNPRNCTLVAYLGSEQDIIIPNEIDGLFVQAIPNPPYFFYGGLNANSVIFTDNHKYWSGTMDSDSNIMITDDGIWSYIIRIDPWPYETEQPTIVNKPYIIIMAYNGNEEQIVIPETLHECLYPVRSIGSHAFSFLQATNIVFPSSLIHIESEAFYKCPSLEICIDDDVMIDNFPAVQCKRIAVSCQYSDYEFPDVEIVEMRHTLSKHDRTDSSEAYWFCKYCGKPFEDKDGTIEMEAVDYGRCGYNVIWILDDNGLLTISGSGKMYSHPWDKYKIINKVVVENGVTSICDFAFSSTHQSHYDVIILPDDVENISKYAFYGRKPTIYAPFDSKTARLLSLQDMCFYVADTGFGYRYLYSANPITGENEEPIIGVELSGCTQKDITSCVIPDYITSIGYCAFQGCYNLESITLPTSITKIEGRAFYNCTSLSNITIPNSVVDLKSEAFYGCSSLRDIVIPNSISSLGMSCFSGCNLDSVYIPDSVTYIHNQAFWPWSTVNTIFVETCNSYAANWAQGSGCDVVALTHQNIVVDTPAVPPTEIKEGLTEGKHCTFCQAIMPQREIPALKDMTVLILPEDTTIIEAEAFSNVLCQAIIIPDGCTTIGERAFAHNSSLLYVRIPANITHIEDNAFEGCDKVTIFKDAD